MTGKLKPGHTLRLPDRYCMVVESIESVTNADMLREWVVLVSNPSPPYFSIVVVWENGDISEMTSRHTLVEAAANYAEQSGQRL